MEEGQQAVWALEHGRHSTMGGGGLQHGGTHRR